MRVSNALSLALANVAGGDHQRRRVISIVHGAITALAGRGVSIVVSLLSVPLTIRYLGAEQYGIWVLLSSLFAWIRLADLGIGMGLTNAVVAAAGTEDFALARSHVTTAIAFLTMMSIGIGILVLAAWPWIDWNALFGATSDSAKTELGPVIAMSLTFFLISFPLSVVGTTYNALQAGKTSNYWSMGGNVASLIALLFVTSTRGGLIWLVVAVSGVALLTNVMSGIWLFTRCKPLVAPRLASLRSGSVSGLMRVGVPFFLIQITALVVFQTDSFIVAHYLGAGKVPVYSLTYNLFGYTSLIQTLAFNYVWVAYADAIARKDIKWVKRTLKANIVFSIGTTLATVIPLILIARPFIAIWAGLAVVPMPDLVYWMAAWSLINAFCSPIACLLAASSQMKAQVIYSAVSAVCNIFLSIYLINLWGVTGVIAGSVVAYLVFVCIPASIDVHFLLKRLDHAL